MKKNILLSLILITVFIFNQTIISQTASSELSSYQKARQVLLKGIQAMGGFEILNSIKTISVIYKEHDSNRGQNLTPDLPDVMEQGNEAKYYFDAVKNFTRFERNFQRRGRLFNSVFVYKNEEGFFYWPETKELHPSINVPLIKKLFNYRYTSLPKVLPQNVLTTALQNAASLRWVGELKQLDKNYDVVSFAYSDGSLATLYFDHESGLLSKCEELISDLLLGDTTGEVVYSNYRENGELKFPFTWEFYVGGRLKQKIEHHTIKFNQPLDEKLFEPPAGIEPSKYPQPFSPQKLADGVFFVPLFNATGISYNSMFVVFEDYVLVMDAPLSDLLSQFYLGLISRVAPGKPVKYVVPTHFHWDHSGGIKQFVASGSQVVTTPGNENFFRKVVSVPRTLQSNLSDLSDKISFELFTDKKVIEDKTQKIELYNIGPNPHADEIVIAYLPEYKILYVTDLFWGVLAEHDPPARKTLTDFAEKIDALGLDIKVIAPGHGKVSTIEELRRALKAS